MEALEEVVGVPNKDLFHIVKGKRTKRLRFQSPNIPFTVTTEHDNSLNDSDKGEDHVHLPCSSSSNNNNNYDNNDNNNATMSSTTTSPEIFINTFTDEEEETARCLVLMSKCHDDHHLRPPRTLTDGKFDLFNTKFNSKRYIETSSNLGNGTKAGIYVYECKTCNRTFSSFQALGGHRASHKKPKTTLTNELLVNNYKKSYFDFSDDNEDDQQPSPSTTLYNNNKNNNKNVTKTLPNSSSPRVHECSYCGAEFTSGQALGGHMRRHRGGINVISPLHLNNVSPATSIGHQEIFGNNNNNNNMKKVTPKDGLSLDLNIPVQDQEQTQRQQLVDCHY